MSNVNLTARQPAVRVRPGARHGDGELQLRGCGLEGHPYEQLLPLEIDPAGVFKTATITAPRRSRPTPRASRRTRVRSRPAATASRSPHAGQRRRPVLAPLTIVSNPTRASAPAVPAADPGQRARHRQVRQRRARQGRPDEQLHGRHGEQTCSLYISTVQGSGSEIIEETNVVAESVSSADTTGQMRTVDGMYMYNLTTEGDGRGQGLHDPDPCRQPHYWDGRPDRGATAEEVAIPAHGRNPICPSGHVRSAASADY